MFISNARLSLLPGAFSMHHRKYIISAVEKRGELLGLRMTRHFRGPVYLMVDFVSPSTMLGGLLSSVRRPTLVMHPGLGSTGTQIKNACWKLPVKHQFPFFVTTWSQGHIFDMTGITLAASDF